MSKARKKSSSEIEYAGEKYRKGLWVSWERKVGGVKRKCIPPAAVGGDREVRIRGGRANPLALRKNGEIQGSNLGGTQKGGTAIVSINQKGVTNGISG